MKQLRNSQSTETSSQSSSAMRTSVSGCSGWGNLAEQASLSSVCKESPSQGAVSKPWETGLQGADQSWWQESKETPEGGKELTDAQKREPFETPQYRNVRGERVQVASEWEAQEAERIMTLVEDVYKIEMGTFRDGEQAEEGLGEGGEKAAAKGIFGRGSGYSGSSSSPVPWEYKELVAIERGCKHYAAILGDARKTSSRKDADQEVDTILKRNRSGNALADYTSGYDRVRFFTTGTNADFDFDNNAQQLEGTVIHELAHGLCRYKLDEYSNEVVQGKEGRKEGPITNYGGSSAGEDLSESMMFFFLKPEKLKSSCPKRYEFIQKMVEEWTKDDKDKKS